MIFWFCLFYGQKMQEKVSKYSNVDKNGQGEYLTINFRHFTLTLFQLGRDNFYHRNSISREKA